MSLKKEVNILMSTTRFTISLGIHVLPLMELTTNC